MHACFTSWRRKLGWLTLGFALVLTCGWLRSSVMNHWELLKGDYEYQCLISSRGQLAWIRLTPDVPKARSRPDAPIDMHSPEVRFRKNAPVLADRAMVAGLRIDGTYEWKAGLCGLEVGEIRYGNLRASIWKAQYGSLTIPLILLSAYLLLWKPRQPSTPTDQRAL